MSRRVFVVGGLVRVEVDQPVGAPLRAGDVLTVHEFDFDDEHGAFAVLVPGRWGVPLTMLVPVRAEDVPHPEDGGELDAEEADAWGDVVDLDPAFRDLEARYEGLTFDELAMLLHVKRPGL